MSKRIIEDDSNMDLIKNNYIIENILKLKLTKNVLTVLEKRYLLKDENGNIIGLLKDMFKRVARVIANIDQNYCEDSELSFSKFYKIMTKL